MLRCLLLAAVLVLALALAPARGIPFTEEGLASKESLRGPYDRRQRHYMVARAGLKEDDNARRFNVFKENVRYIHEVNKKDRPFRLALKNSPTRPPTSSGGRTLVPWCDTTVPSAEATAPRGA